MTEDEEKEYRTRLIIAGRERARLIQEGKLKSSIDFISIKNKRSQRAT